MNFPSRFIRATDKVCDHYAHVPAPLFRRLFTVDGRPKKASLCICGLGFYELYINGKRITKGALAPYISNPDDILYYDCYDVAELLRPGENAVGVMLGNGFMNPFGGKIWGFEKAKWRGPLRLALELTWESDKETRSLQSDESFKTAPSPVTFDDLRVGAFYDANLEKGDWSSPGYDDSGWQYALPADAPAGEPRICRAEPVTVYREISPVSIQHFDDFCFCCRKNTAYKDPIEQTRVKDTYLYDFGENNSGVCRLKIRGTKGQTVKLRFGDLMTDGYLSVSDTIFIRPTSGYYFDYPQMDTYTLKGEGEEVFVPPFTYHGFRYVLVEGITPEQATRDLLTYLVMSSSMEERSRFSCSDDLLDRIFEMCRRSDRSNFVYIPTDCPHREKNGWTADAALSSEHMLLTMAAENSFREWLHNIRKAQRADGALPGIIPTAGWGFEWGNGPAWDCVCAYIPYYCYQYTGDKTVLEENAQMILKYLKYASTRRDRDGLVAFGLSDWVQPGHPADGPDCPLRVSDSMVLLDTSNKAVKIFAAIGHSEGEAFARQLSEQMRSSIRDRLIDRTQMLVEGNCQTSQALALAFGVFEPDEEQQAMAQLIRLIHEADDRMDCGVIGARWIYRVLLEHGQADLAYKMTVGPGFPSYGDWVRQGATTLRESFYRKDDIKGSYNHHFWGDICAVFVQYFAGIKPNPHWRDVSEFEISPLFPEALSRAEASFRVDGDRWLTASWHRENEKTVLCVSAPDGIHGRIKFPDGWQLPTGETSVALSSGSYPLQRAVIS